jgi:hypothetical protein
MSPDMPLIRLFLDICLFKKGPQDTPASPVLMGLAVLAYLGVGMVLLGLETAWGEALLQVIVEALMLFGFIAGALILAGKRPRLVQTATALYASDALISSLAVPLLAWLLVTPDVKSVYLLLLLLMLWHLAVLGHILRHALSVPMSLGIGLAFVYMVSSYQIMMALFDRMT